MQPDKKSYFAIRTPQLCGIALTTEKRRRGAKTVRWTVLAWGTLAGGSPVRSTNPTIFREERSLYAAFKSTLHVVDFSELFITAQVHPDDVTYSWWSYRFRSRERNTGWRIDYFLTSNRLRDRITDASIHNEIFGSDHCPIELDID